MDTMEKLLWRRRKLIESWKDTSSSERAKLLVKIMDIDSDIQQLLKERKKLERQDCVS